MSQDKNTARAPPGSVGRRPSYLVVILHLHRVPPPVTHAPGDLRCHRGRGLTCERGKHREHRLAAGDGPKSSSRSGPVPFPNNRGDNFDLRLHPTAVVPQFQKSELRRLHLQGGHRRACRTSAPGRSPGRGSRARGASTLGGAAQGRVARDALPTPLSPPGGPTCRKGELHLLVHDLQGDEVVLLVEAAVVKQQGVPLLRGKPVGPGGSTSHTDRPPRRGLARRPGVTAGGGRGQGATRGKDGPQALVPVGNWQPVKPDERCSLLEKASQSPGRNLVTTAQ